MQLNMQPVEKQNLREDGALDIVSCFYTIQGEGPFSGMPAVFIRTAGCDLQCPACDSDYTTNRKLHTVEEIVTRVKELMPLSGLVVLTGGEPLRQNLVPVIRKLRDFNYQVQIETNGTFFLDSLWNSGTIVCSPKTGSINEKLKPYIRHLKYIVANGKVDPEDGLPTDSLGAGVRVARPWPGFKGTVWVQPLDSGNAQENSLHRQEAVNSCLKWNYRLCLQIHKLCGLD